MSFSSAANLLQDPVSSFAYRNVGATAVHDQPPFFASETKDPHREQPVMAGVPQHEVERLLAEARAQATSDARRGMQAEAEAKIAEQIARTEAALESFQHEQKKYFSLAEAELVKLSLAIAARILHREAQVDPMLVAGLVRVAIEKLASGSTVTVRVAPEQSEYWRAYRAAASDGLHVIVVEDLAMKCTECTLETELGSADFSLEAQLKEVERGFCDLLALRPQAG